ncbi:hypothetical protein GS636_21470 [Ruegeria sp. HKCCD4884]|uniref:hypothetical protein n=1 Tax=Ruegeria sp. HKCCD4884 TaxID=2683022 RepID=UPI0014928AEF|nr:hypothetical protein [Ruegeria sp. HKCCD4884]NOD95376.1 hypothetical protein [Ruegeria sp. HKCCD4884]
MSDVSAIRRQFGISALQWDRAKKKAARRSKSQNPHPGLILMMFLVEMRDLNVEQAMDEIERVTGARPLPSPTATLAKLEKSLWR